MEKVNPFLSKWIKGLVLLSATVTLLLPIYFIRLEKELRIFKRNTLSYKKFVEASFETPEGAFSVMPLPLRNIPFGEQTGLVLGTHRLQIRGMPYPYNAALLKREDSGYHLLFRYDLIDENVKSGLTSYIAHAELDEDFKQTAKPYEDIDTGSQFSEDPRIFQAVLKNIIEKT